ncbi:MAG: PEPxxWA-CTERM sorting domain-containing protein [Proteobacteria bacterium]|nr:PEPxxWA-CTERM sorting domain-containing protein [Pseudomonadota bacterium]
MKKLSLAVATALSALSIQANAAPVQWAGNGHYYEFISAGTSFDGALAAAAASSFNGQQGYLATVTSADEQAFIYGSVTTAATWFSGSDRETEGTWKWLAGPEAGTVFWQTGVTLTYANWSGGEPNDAGNEDVLWGNWNGSAWNDINSAQLGYVIEYGGLANGGVPEPATWALMIAGFGMAGAAMRRRGRKPALA